MHETDVLIIGSGPAGSSAALMCSSYGLPNMVITKHRWLADTPRAHYKNQRTMEIMRDLGIADQVIAQASPREVMGNVVFCTSLAGEELGRIPYGANQPKRASDYLLASPCEQCDLPQNLLEPILLSNAASRGSHVRFDTEYLSHAQDPHGVTVSVRDNLTQSTYQIRTKYLLGADGSNSKVAADLQLPMDGQMGLAGSVSIIFHADLSRHVAHRPGYLWWMLQPGADVGGIGMGLLRMVRPWDEWQIVWGYDIEKGAPELSEENARRIASLLIGDDSIPIKIHSVSAWTVNQMYATRYSLGRVFCLGDAVHRHPPSNGLGSNTSIQDAYNLTWKLALVLKGQASPSLLDTYDAERVPIGKQIVARANQSVRDFSRIFTALGVSDTADEEQISTSLARLKVSGAEAATCREKLRQAVAFKSYEFSALGVELNIRYRSTGVIDEQDAATSLCDPELYYRPSTQPGGRIPHVWLGQGGRQVSTLDIVGKGSFTLLTGIGGECWKEAAESLTKTLGVPINTYCIGHGRDLQDLYGDWADIREFPEDGCILIRPDGYIAWRSMACDTPRTALSDAFDFLLGLHA